MMAAPTRKSCQLARVALRSTRALPFLLFVTAVLLSCGRSEPKHQWPNQYSLILIDTLNFGNAEAHAIPTTEVKHYTISGRSWVTFYDHIQEALLIYDFEDRTKCTKINIGAATNVLLTDEVDFMINGYYVRSLDSIYVLLNPLNKIVLVDGNSRIRKTWTISTQRKHDPKQFYLLSFFGDAPMEMIDNRLLTLQQLPDPDYATDRELLRTKFEAYIDAVIVLDQDTAIVTEEIGRWPLLYTQKYYNDVTPCRTIDDHGRVVYSFGVSDSIHIWELNGQHKSTYISGNREEFAVFDGKRESDAAYVDAYVVEQPRYRKLMYDAFNKVYYRVLIHHQPYTNPQNELNLYSDKSWSIQILDQELKLVGVVDFEARRYNFETLVVTPKGLLVEIKPKGQITSNEPTFALYVLTRSNN